MVSVRRCRDTSDVPALLVNAAGTPIPIATDFLAYVSLRGCSPNTVLAYAYDLAHLWRFFASDGLNWDHLTPDRAPELLIYLQSVRSARCGLPAGPCSQPRADSRRRHGSVAEQCQPCLGSGVSVL